MLKVRYILWSALWTTMGVMWLWASWSSMPWWAVAALAALFFGKAALPLIQLVGIVKARRAEASLARGFRAMAIGYVAAGILIGVGAAWQRSFVGFLAAYAAVSFAWVWFWIIRQLSRASDA